MNYQITVGIECHVQLATKTKLFSEVDNDARDKEPNSCVSPVDYALPGMLPRLNQAAVEFAVRAGHALSATINPYSRFDRKHYYYPDLPKGYQISQLHQPIIGAGQVSLPDGSIVRIEHAHLEEDAGKLTHFDHYSLVDLNRAGTPLLEIVSMPDIHSAKQAHDYCKELWRLMIYAGVCHGDLYHGNMRFDVNISLAPAGSTKLGTRAEIKNLNSFRSVERAIEYEYQRQSQLLAAGQPVIQETRGWSDATGKTTAQRSKEEAQDYRYMPEPDIPPLHLTAEFIKEQKQQLPLLPADYRARLQGILPPETIEVLLDYQALAMKLTEITEPALVKKLANLFTSVLLAEEYAPLLALELPSTAQLTELLTMNQQNQLSSTATKEVFLALFEQQYRETSARQLATEKKLLQENDMAALEVIVDQVLADPATKQAQADFRAGQEKVLGFLVGQVMKASRGSANPAAVQQILRQKLLN
ncbi:MAG: Asp-tRNA(Asn)/Glu-tRNA(Gln) amidotransferase subunit GatB [Candidatus Saccharibacteria bacterium]|nr:Asp-tRNA(Asn)/Glu-tRNA(Gln) amidotransferase subunit GatB [Candidatus Saccharibacteria bacterium]